jgi:predicted amidohydrolase YtcJ
MSVPGPIREAHAHLFAYGQALVMPSLAGCTSVAECLEAVRAAVARAAPTEGVRAVRLHSARVESWAEQRWPTLDELDAASEGALVAVMSFDHHSAMANSAALQRAGLRPGVPVPPHGVVCTDRQGRPTGLLLEQAAYAAWSAFPEPRAEERRAIVGAALDALRALGYREVHDLHSQEWLGPLLRRMDLEEALPIPVVLYPNVSTIQRVAAVAGAWETPRVVLGGAKLFSDGTLNSRTALMLHRYAEPLADMPRGRCMASPAEVEAAIRTAAGLGLGLAVHAIGDGAVRTVLDCVQRLGPACPRGTVRLEHCELIDRADVPRFAALGVTCSVQPCHLLADIEALHRYVPHRLDRVLPLRELLASGLEPGVIGTPDNARAGLVFGSDVPIVRADPEDSIRAAVERRRSDRDEPIAPDQAITREQAWACFGLGRGFIGTGLDREARMVGPVRAASRAGPAPEPTAEDRA